MDEFAVLLVIAFVVIGAMLLIGTPLAEWAENGWGPGGGGPGGGGNYRILTSFELGKVGLTENEVSRTARFGSFTLGQTQEEVLKEMPSLRISQGYFGSDPKEFEIDVEENILSNLKDIKVSFGIDESNLYGNLIVEWNDKVFFSELANLRSYDVYITPDEVKETNFLKISAANPGLYFWAATYYNLGSFRVIGEYGPEKLMSFKVYSGELESWSKGTLKFYTTRGQAGEIIVKLNGNEIYRDSDPEHYVVEEFEFSDIGNFIRAGDNILSFKSESEYSIDDVEFEISTSSGRVIKETDFNVTSSDIGMLNSGKKGYVTFDVDSIEREGVLDIKLNNNRLNLQTVRTGENSIEFDKDDVEEGANSISFSGTGTWDISEVEVKIQK
jgi:hypothetical protein